MHDVTRRTVVRYGTRYGLGGGAVLFAATVGLRVLYPLLTARSFLFFVALGCLVVGVVPFLLVDHSVTERNPGGDGGMLEASVEAIDVTTAGQLRYKVGFALLATGAYSLAAFLLLGAA